MLRIEHLTKTYGNKRVVDDPYAACRTGRDLRLHRTQRCGQDHHALLVCVATVLYAWFHASVGLIIDLRHANLNWTDESIPVKRSISVLISFFIGLAFCCVAVIAGCLFSGVVGCIPILIGFALLIAGLVIGAHCWLQGRGAAVFATL